MLPDYHELKLSVRSIAETSLSFMLACYCQTPGVSKVIEPCPIRVTVNFYKFKAWIIERDWIVNFENWLFKYKGTAHYYSCLADYINAEQGRTKVYLPPTDLSLQLDSLIAQAKEVTETMKALAGA